MKEKKRSFRKELKQPDEFQTFWEKVYEYVRKHRRNAILATSGALLLVLLVVGVTTWRTNTEKAAAALLAEAQSLLAAGGQSAGMDALLKKEAAPAEVAEKKDRAAELLRELAERYKGSTAAQLGRILLGQVYYEKGAFEEAAQTYLAALERRRGSPEMAALAREGLAYAQEAKGEFEQARAAYELLSKTDLGYLRGRALLGLARCCERLGQKEGALDAYRKFLADYPQHPRADEAKAKMARISDQSPPPAIPESSAPPEAEDRPAPP